MNVINKVEMFLMEEQPTVEKFRKKEFKKREQLENKKYEQIRVTI